MQRFARLSTSSAGPSIGLVGLAAMLGSAGNAAAHDGVEARLKSFQEVPAVVSTASGRFKASIDEKGGVIRYELNYSGLQGDVRQAHIHLGQRGVNGGIMVWLCQTTTNPDPQNLAPTCPQSGSVSGMIQAANVAGPTAQGVDPMDFAELVAAIRAGVAYANVHSSRFPGGELRGQLKDDD